MPKRPPITILAALFSAAAFAQLPDGEGKAVTEKICNNCHGPENYVGKRLPKDGWEEVIERMIGQGAQASDADFDQIAIYLTNTFGPKINVNQASAEELEAAFELPAGQGAAIAGYREKNGAFKTLDDLKRVPRVDQKKIEARKNRIDF